MPLKNGLRLLSLLSFLYLLISSKSKPGLVVTAVATGDRKSGFLPPPDRSEDGVIRYPFINSAGEKALASIHERFFQELPRWGYRVATDDLFLRLRDAEKAHGYANAAWELQKVVRDLLRNRTD